MAKLSSFFFSIMHAVYNLLPHTCSVLDKYYVGVLVDNEFPVFPEMG